MSDFGNCQVMAENLSYYMSKHNLNRYDIAGIADVSYSAVTDWLKARKYPRIDKIERIANYLGVNKSALIETHPAETGSEQNNALAKTIGKVLPEPDSFRRDLLLCILSLSDEQQHVIQAVAEAMRKR